MSDPFGIGLGWAIGGLSEGAGAPPFSPSDLPGVVLFASPDTGVVLDGSSRVSQWTDGSGAGNHLVQGTAASRPFVLAGDLSGNDAYDFQDGQVLVMNVNASTIFAPDTATDYMISMICRSDAHVSDTFFYLPEGAAAQSANVFWSGSNALSLTYRNLAGATTTITLGGAHYGGKMPNDYYHFHLEKEGSTIRVWINGYIVHTILDAQSLIFTSGEGGSPLAIGARADGNTPLNGAIVMVLLGTNILTNDQRASLMSWCYTELGLTSRFLASDGGADPNSPIADPIALYVPSLNRTYYAYEGQSGEPKITQYDHATGAWSRSYSIGASIGQSDHNEVTIIRLASGRLLAFYGPHNDGDEGKIVRRTSNPDDITQWETVGEVGVNVGYPRPFIHGSTVYCLLRNGAFILSLYSSTDDGATWSGPTQLIDGSAATTERPYMSRMILAGDLLHMVGLFAPEPHRRDVWHAIYNFANGSIRNIAGTHSVAAGSLPITKEAMKANGYLIYDSPDYTSEGTRDPDVKMDASGNLHVTWQECENGVNAWHKYTKTTGGADGGSWDSPTILGTVGVNGPPAAFNATTALRLRPDGKIDVYASDAAQLTSSSTLGVAGAGNIIHYHYDGASWGAPATLMAGTDFRQLNHPRVPIGLPDEIHLLFAEEPTTETQRARIFVFGGAAAPSRLDIPMRMGNSSPSADEEAPTVPLNLSATTVSSTAIDLTWDASTDNVGVTGYNVYRDDVLIGSSLTTSYSDTGLASSTEYTYTVTAFDGASNESAQSAPDSATTSAAGRPTFVGTPDASSSATGAVWPAGIANGDLAIFCQIVIGSPTSVLSTMTLTNNDGLWTAGRDTTTAEGTVRCARLKVWKKLCSGAETGNISGFSRSGGTVGTEVNDAGCLIVVRGASLTFGDDQVATGADDPVSAPNLAASANHLGMLIAVYSDDAGAFVNFTGGTGTDFTVGDQIASSSGTDRRIAFFSANLDAGTSGKTEATARSTDRWIVQGLVAQPA